MLKKAMILLFAMAAGVAAFALLARAGSEPAHAVEPPPSYGPAVLETFEAVDEVEARSNEMRLRGVLLGAGDVVERVYHVSNSDTVFIQTLLQRCERLALLALTKPGAYQLDVDQYYYGYAPSCTLRRND
jgi:hypothetical protein